MARLSRLLVVGLLAACARTPSGPPPQVSPPVATNRRQPAAESQTQANASYLPRSRSKHGLGQELALFGMRTADGTPLDFTELLRALGKAEAICVGERHDNVHDHQAQLAIFRALLERASATGRELAIGLEMFSVNQQKYLDAYSQGTIALGELRQKTSWDRNWGFPFSEYRPLFRTAYRHHATILALNARRDLVKQVAHRGIRHLDRSQRQRLPEIDFSDDEHYAAFEHSMREHPPTAGSTDSLYEAQLLWDETMAETAANWLNERRPLRQIVIIAGAEHCKRGSIPNRIERRLGNASIVSAIPVLDPQIPGPDELDSGFDYALVLSTDPSATALATPQD